MKHSAQSGNALWFILLAIALMAILTMTIGRISSTVDQNGDIERMRIYSSGLMRYAAGVQQTIEQMRMRGVSENDLSFENATLAGYANANCAVSDCKIFDVGGGGQTYQPAPTEVSSEDWLFTGANNVAGVGTDGTGSTSSTDNELLMILPGISQQLCERINAELDISGVPQDTAKADIATKFTGAFPNGEVIEEPARHKAGCFEGNQDGGGGAINGTYYFYHTLIAR
jgi:hypothetical protein